VNKRILIILFAVLGVLLLVYFLSDNKKRYNWTENYHGTNDQPYGALFVRKLLESYRPEGSFFFNEKKPLSNVLGQDKYKSNTDYIFIGGTLHMDIEDTEALLSFVENGNDAFIACLEPPEKLIDRIYYTECDLPFAFESNRVRFVTMNFYHDTLKTEKGYTYSKRIGLADMQAPWRSFDDELFCEGATAISPLGYQQEFGVNFARLQWGKGYFYIHTNPLVFTNYFLTKEKSVDYASSVFTHLRGENIIWDEYSKLPFMGDKSGPDSPLYYVLRQPALKYAWWLLLVTVLLYVFFAAKRTQRVIPVLEAKSNTSLEFINLVSSLHYQNANHLDMARKKMKYFLYFVRSKYGIHTPAIGEKQIANLAEKSKIPLPEVQMIFTQYELIERNSAYNIEAGRLVDFYNAIENFYKHCK